MKHTFNTVPSARLPRSVFDLSHSLKTTFDCGKLTPCYFEEIYPGDSFNCHVNAFCRLTSPLSVPIMDDLSLDFHFFFVPARLTWQHWQQLHGENDVTAGIDNRDWLTPTVNAATNSVGSLGDYFGVPQRDGAPNAVVVSALPFRAYWRIWNEWFRDENLQAPVPVNYGDTNSVWSSWHSSVPDSQKVVIAWDGLAPRNKKHDYFTSCLPWPQKGPGVELPLGGTAAVVGNGTSLGLYGETSTGADALFGLTRFQSGGDTGFQASASAYSSPVGSLAPIDSLLAPGTSVGVTTDPSSSGLVADLSSATAITINSLRQAFQLQRLYERDSVSGSRYTEVLRAHFGVVSPDARLQRTEFLGGFSQPIKINPVAQTSATDSETPQANLAAFGVTGASRHGFTKSFVEHGFVIGLVSVRQTPTYQQGLRRVFSRRTRFDYYYPTLAHLGEQAVLNKEICLGINNTQNNGVFGYQERWAELRFSPNMVTGYMRSGLSQSLDVWHLSEYFATLPSLNSTFIKDNTPIDRAKAVTSGPDFLLDCYFKVSAARCLPVYGTPGLVDHF